MSRCYSTVVNYLGGGPFELTVHLEKRLWAATLNCELGFSVTAHVQFLVSCHNGFLWHAQDKWDMLVCSSMLGGTRSLLPS